MQYAELDKRIIEVISERGNPLYHKYVYEEAKRLAEATGRVDFRVIDRRLQALRKAGKILYLKKTKSNGQNGWYVV